MAEVASLEARVSLTGTEQVKRAGEQTSQALGKIAGSAQQTGAATAPAAKGIDNLQKAGSRANHTLIEFGRVLEDAPFGIRGIANNIPIALQSFTRLRSSAQSAGVSVKDTLVGALRGPGGLLLAVSAASAAMIVLPGLLRRIGGAAKDAAADVREFADELIELDRPGGVRFNEQQITDAIRNTRRDLRRAQGVLGEAGFAQQFPGALQGNQAVAEALDEQLKTLVKIRDEEKRRLGVRQALIEAGGTDLELEQEAERVSRLKKGIEEERRQKLREITQQKREQAALDKEAARQAAILAQQARDRAESQIAIQRFGTEAEPGAFGRQQRGLQLFDVRPVDLDGQLLRPLRITTEQMRLMRTEWQNLLVDMEAVVTAGLDPFLNSFTDGIANILLGLGDMHDLLRSIRVTMATVAAELLKLGIITAIRAGAAALTGGGSEAATAGATIASGFRTVASASAAPGPLQLSARVSGTDLVFLIEQTQARRAR